jgi:hypothetical protein
VLLRVALQFPVFTHHTYPMCLSCSPKATIHSYFNSPKHIMIDLVVANIDVGISAQHIFGENKRGVF